MVNEQAPGSPTRSQPTDTDLRPVIKHGELEQAIKDELEVLSARPEWAEPDMIRALNDHLDTAVGMGMLNPYMLRKPQSIINMQKNDRDKTVAGRISTLEYAFNYDLSVMKEPLRETVATEDEADDIMAAYRNSFHRSKTEGKLTVLRETRGRVEELCVSRFYDYLQTWELLFSDGKKAQQLRDAFEGVESETMLSPDESRAKKFAVVIDIIYQIDQREEERFSSGIEELHALKMDIAIAHDKDLFDVEVERSGYDNRFERGSRRSRAFLLKNLGNDLEEARLEAFPIYARLYGEITGLGKNKEEELITEFNDPNRKLRSKLKMSVELAHKIDKELEFRPKVRAKLTGSRLERYRATRPSASTQVESFPAIHFQK